MNSISGFELIKNLNNTFLAKCTDFSTIHVSRDDAINARHGI